MLRDKFIKIFLTLGTGGLVWFGFVLAVAKELGNQKVSLKFHSFIFSFNW